MAKYEQKFKEEVVQFAKENGNWEASKKYKIKLDTVKYWADAEFREKIKTKENNHHNRLKDDPEYRRKSRERSREDRKNPERIECSKKYYEKNKEKIEQYKKNWRAKNIDSLLEKSRQKYQEKRANGYVSPTRTPEQRKRRNELDKEHYKNPNHKLKIKLYASIHRAIKGNKNGKTYSSLEYLGCDIPTFRKYIEDQFEPNMTWDNNKPYIPKVQEEVWHLDHIIPVSLIDLNNEEQIKKITHYTNYKPIWAKDNFSKYNKVDIEHAHLCPIKYSEKALADELNSIKIRKGTIETPPTHNKIVLSCQHHFYEKERELLKDPIIRDRLIQNRVKYLEKSEEQLTIQEIFRGFRISGIHKGFSHFSPLWFKYFIEKYSVKTVYDPCAGWGHRLLGAHNLDRYIYNDFDERTAAACVEINEKFNPLQETPDNQKVFFYANRAEDFVPMEEYEAIFSCFPYASKEVYKDTMFKDHADFVDWCERAIRKCTKEYTTKIAGMVMSSSYLEEIKNPFLSNGYELVEESTIYSSKDHFNKKATNKTTEVLMVFKKNC